MGRDEIKRIKLGASEILSGPAGISEFSFLCPISAGYELHITKKCDALVALKLIGCDQMLPLPPQAFIDKISVFLFRGNTYKIIIGRPIDDDQELVAIYLCLKPSFS